MPLMHIGPVEFAELLEAYAKELVKDVPVPTDRAAALRASVRLMAHIAVIEKAGTFRALEREFNLRKRPVGERLVPFAMRVPRGALLS